jgi:F0F1-type ATP synthase delta subunit
MKLVTISAPIKLTSVQVEALKTQLQLSDKDSVTFEVNPSLIAGLKIVVDGKALDLSVKRQLADIVGNN